MSVVALYEAAEYQAEVHLVFERVARELSGLLPSARIEHVGASSIPGAISKGDLDICVVVAPPTHSAATMVLEANRYVIKSDTHRDDALCMLIAPNGEMDVAIQLIAEGSKYEIFMRFRDALRESPKLVDQYNQRKRSLASASPERYRDEKSMFIESVIHGLHRSS